MRLLILGLGPAGAAAAIAACAHAAQVVIVGRSPAAGPRPGETLSPHARPLLSRLGIHDLIRKHHLPSPGIVSVWEGEQPYENDFVFNPYGDGWHLDRVLFDRQLLVVAAERRARIVNRAKLRSVRRGGDEQGWIVNAEVNRKDVEFHAELVVDATGRSAWFARRIGIERMETDRLIGIVGFLDRSIDRDARTYLEAAADGWWYFANLPGNRSVAAFMTDGDLAVTRPGGPTALWRERLNDSRRGRLIENPASAALRMVPANSARLREFAGSGWAAAGDAAASWDPLSSQGIATALDGGMRAARALLGPSNQVREYGDWVEATWADYVRSHGHFYGLVKRWPESTFWQRRRANFFFDFGMDASTSLVGFEVGESSIAAKSEASGSMSVGGCRGFPSTAC